jgi:hypothetical protein
LSVIEGIAARKASRIIASFVACASLFWGEQPLERGKSARTKQR